MRRGSSRAVAAFAAVIVVALVGLALPSLGSQRETLTSTPVPPDLQRVALVRLGAGEQACAAPVVLERRTGEVRFTARPRRGGRGPALRVVASGGGYRAVGRVPAGFAKRAALRVVIASPTRTVTGRVCIRAAGPVALEATTMLRRAQTTVDGRRASADVALALAERGTRTRASLAGAVLRRVTTFRPGVVTPATVGLLILVLLGLAVGAVPWAYARALRSDAAARRASGAPRAPQRRNSGRQ